jgi:hypothetical protein
MATLIQCSIFWMLKLISTEIAVLFVNGKTWNTSWIMNSGAIVTTNFFFPFKRDHASGYISIVFPAYFREK